MSDVPEREVSAERTGGPTAGRGAYAGYPSELECDVTISTGETLHMRPIRPSDGDRLIEFHRNLSPGTVYKRFFSVHPELSASEVIWFTHVDYTDRLALIVLAGETMVAVGRYDRVPGTSEAEVAFLVTDQYQHHGIGRLLLEHLADAAWPVGVTAFCAETMAENKGMIRVFEDSGFPVSKRLSQGVLSVKFPIDPALVNRGPSSQRRAARRDLAAAKGETA
jgi:GNAT superfamily N-acetyltransferase